MRAVVGLRNPGPDYDGTRHNIGYEVVAGAASDAGVSLGRAPSRVKALVAQVGPPDDRTILVAPHGFMNQCGGPVRSVLAYWKIEVADLLVVHDDIDLAFGRMRLQVGGGSGGHNGIRSIETSLGTAGFSRLKLGVGRPPGSMDPADFVLRRFNAGERAEVDLMVEDAVAVVGQWATDRGRAQETAALRGRDV